MSTKLLKAEFHLHTSDDPRDVILYSAREIVERAIRREYGVLAITNHDAMTVTDDLVEYAAERGLILLRGAEATIGGGHVLLYKSRWTREDFHGRFRTFDDVRAFRGPDTLVIAAHPYYPNDAALGEKLEANIDCFDAVEYSHFYSRLHNFNKRAVAVARRHGLPLVGTSDCHFSIQFESTYSLLEAEPTPTGVFEAVKAGRVRIVTRPASREVLWTFTAREGWKGKIRAARALLRPQDFLVLRRDPSYLDGEHARAVALARAPRRPV
ncbi:MAG: PHP domain-containing protein, partial [Candidatus Methylomirabilis sp.]|nr:PHP domain-containing protein [Deltaproteobacteria bacterium]